jgi:hypothetical protein
MIIISWISYPPQNMTEMLERIGVKSIDNLVDSFHPTLSNGNLGLLQAVVDHQVVVIMTVRVSNSDK